MNPGSSQFASQFPDAEETMSKMESKKLLTSPDHVNGLPIYEGEAARTTKYLSGQTYNELVHDARIAHEQREVIRQLVGAINDCRSRLAIHMKHTEDLMADMTAHKALAAAAPFLEALHVI